MSSKQTKQQTQQKKNGNKQKSRPQYQNKKKMSKKNKTVPKKEEKVAFKLRTITSHVDPDGGNRSNIMYEVPIDVESVLGSPCGWLSAAMTRGLPISDSLPFWAYSGFVQDVAAVGANSEVPINARLCYLNNILGTLAQKSVPYSNGEVTFKWNNLETIQINNSVNVRGYKYYLYRSSDSGPPDYNFQEPPDNPSSQADVPQAYAEVSNYLAGTKTHNCVVRNVTLDKNYLKDLSAFASNANYFGQGNSGFNVSSVELPVPFRSQILAKFSETITSVSNRFRLSAGDSTVAMGLGISPEISLNYYDTVYPIRYKFINLDEIVYFLVNWYSALCSKQKSIQQEDGSPDTNFALSPFPYTIQDFRIMVAQSIKSIWAFSSALTQFIVPSTGNNEFEALRCGTNCYPPNIESNMIVPLLLNENLAQLHMKTYEMQTNKFPSAKNVLIAMPVLGVFKSQRAIDLNVETELRNSDGTFSMQKLFQDPTNSEPNVIDGTDPQNNVFDFNLSPKYNKLRAEWNDRINFLKQQSLPQSVLGGCSNSSMILMTRFVKNKEIDVPLESLTERDLTKINKGDIKVRKVQRQISTKSVSVDAKYYVPNNGSLFTQVDDSVSSVFKNTVETKKLLSYLILPIIFNDENIAPSIQNYRVYTRELNILNFPKQVQDNQIGVTRATLLRDFAYRCAPGTAGAKTDEISNVLNTLSQQVAGGFIGDLAAAALSQLIPF